MRFTHLSKDRINVNAFANDERLQVTKLNNFHIYVNRIPKIDIMQSKFPQSYGRNIHIE